MALQPVTLTVWPNPYHAVDHLGRPAGAAPHKRLMQHVNTHQGYVGAECVASAPEKLPPGHAGTPDQDTCWQFSREAVTVSDTLPDQHYLDQVRRGETLPADERTAKLAGIKFLPFDQAIAKSKTAMNAIWRANFCVDLPEHDPFARPRPGGVESPQDVAAKSGAQAAHPQEA